jgi:hypothetical protein
MDEGYPGCLSLEDGPRMLDRLSVVSPKPRHSQHATVLLFPIISLYLSTWALLGVTGVAQRPFYHVCFDSIVVRRGCRWGGTLGMVTDGVNVLSVRSRTTRSSKGKVCPVSSLFSFEHHPDPSLFCLCLTPLSTPLVCLPTSLILSFLPSPT